MAIKDILLLVDIVREDSPATRVAIDLATRMNAHLTGLSLAVDPVVPGFIVAPIPIELIEAARDEAIKSAQAAAGRFGAQAERQGLAYESRITEILMGGLPEHFVANCRLTDLVVIGQNDPTRPEPMREALIESALFDGSAPMLIVPYIQRESLKLNRVMIAWDGTRTAARAVHAALPILELAGKVTIVIVANKAAGPGEPGADLATWLSRRGIDVNIETIPAPTTGVADTLLNHASDHSADLLVMGGYGHSRLREFIIGGATREILATMTVPVLMAH